MQFAGFGPPGGSLNPTAAVASALQELARYGSEPGGLGSKLTLRAKVQRLEGCLGDLPNRLRLVLELSTGIGAPHAFSPAAVARLLHVRLAQLARLEKQALRKLRLAAHTHPGCASAGASAVPTTALEMATGVWGPGTGGMTLASSGVLAAHYSKSPAGGLLGVGVKPPTGGSSSLGLSHPPAASSVLLGVILVLAGILVIGLLFAEELGLGPHFRQWRARVTRRPRR